MKRNKNGGIGFKLLHILCWADYGGSYRGIYPQEKSKDCEGYQFIGIYGQNQRGWLDK